MTNWQYKSVANSPSTDVKCIDDAVNIDGAKNIFDPESIPDANNNDATKKLYV